MLSIKDIKAMARCHCIPHYISYNTEHVIAQSKVYFKMLIYSINLLSSKQFSY